MTANELRIGNWVEIIQPTKEIHTTIQPSCFSVEITNHYQPIPLTEEWLLKFGFDKCEFNVPQKYKKQGCDFSVKFRNENGFTVEYKHGHVCLKHVHQLQNLYFALTGEELTLQQP